VCRSSLRLSVALGVVRRMRRHDLCRWNKLLKDMMRSLGIGCGLAVALLLAAGCSSGEQSSGSGGSEALTVVYEATGQGKASTVVYIGSPGDKPMTQQAPALPWTKEVKAKKGDYVSVSVVGESDFDSESGTAGGAQVTCRITVNGKEVAAVSQDLTAMCDATLS
jgi:hypothetical protein